MSLGFILRHFRFMRVQQQIFVRCLRCLCCLRGLILVLIFVVLVGFLLLSTVYVTL